MLVLNWILVHCQYIEQVIRLAGAFDSVLERFEQHEIMILHELNVASEMIELGFKRYKEAHVLQSFKAINVLRDGSGRNDLCRLHIAHKSQHERYRHCRVLLLQLAGILQRDDHLIVGNT